MIPRAAFENDSFVPLPPESPFPGFAHSRERSSADCRPQEPELIAREVVRLLLRETDLVQLIDANSLIASVGAGNWISWTFRLHPASTDPAKIISKLWNGSGRRSFQRCRGLAGKSAWFRSKGAPSLHFEVVDDRSRARGGGFVRGHVDAANPWSHPLTHFIEDYLPALGFARHPAPAEMVHLLLHPRR